MRQAIITKYIGPTTHRGPRVKATTYAGSVTIPWDVTLDIDGNHHAAAKTLADKLSLLDGGWIELVGGNLPDGNGKVYVLVDGRGSRQ